MIILYLAFFWILDLLFFKLFYWEPKIPRKVVMAMLGYIAVFLIIQSVFLKDKFISYEGMGYAANFVFVIAVGFVGQLILTGLSSIFTPNPEKQGEFLNSGALFYKYGTMAVAIGGHLILLISEGVSLF